LTIKVDIKFWARCVNYKRLRTDASISQFVYKYLDIPLTVKATFDLGNAKIYGVFGPYVGIGLSGKSVSKWTNDGNTAIDRAVIQWGSDKNKSELKRVDFGLTAGTGFEINAIQIGVTYGLGLANISPNTDYGENFRNRVLALSIRYIFFRN
jgi:outer membrane protein W